MRSQNVFLSSGGLVASVVTKKAVSRTSSDLSSWNITSFCSNAESLFGCARLRRLRLVLWLFTSCVWDVLWYRILIKTAFVSWATQKFPRQRWVRCQYVFFKYGGLVASIVTEEAVSRTSSDLSNWNNTSFCSNAVSRFGCARLRRLRLILWLFTSCVRDVLWYRILIESFCFLSKTETFQNDLQYVSKMSF